MAPFDLSRPLTPWVVFGPRTSPVFDEQLSDLVRAGGRVHSLDARGLTDQVSTCDAFAELLGFPGYFGRNWDALVDCLDDLHPHVTGGVGIAVVVQGADALLGSLDLKVFMTSLCLAADRANTEVDPDGEPRNQPVVIEHFVFLLDEVKADEFAPLIEDPDLVVSAEGDFLTVALDLAVWRP
ncbi:MULTISPECIES: barstar family protein [Streptomyces]|uniref:barstar family protein n=1 Tax=Streptomyces TaxID=1883 RepID=UPI0027E31880|nr:barstar family protein [Streptomyces yangpuensis]MBZ9595860.1 barstar family protein [Streptomyces erythrochromogenes]